MKIAAYVNASGEAASLYEPGFFRLYIAHEAKAGQSGWRLAGETPFAIDRAMPLPAIKAALHAAVAALDDCKVLVSSEVRGMLYSVLQEESGFHTWKSEGPLLLQLDHVRQKEIEQEANKRFEIIALAGRPTPAPVRMGEARDGAFWIDLKEALEHESGQTSRQILIPFLERGQFRKLEILCDHLPKWLAWELERLDLSAGSESIDATGVGLRVTIYARDTPEGRRRKVGLPGNAALLPAPCPRERERQRQGRTLSARPAIIDLIDV
jgi:Fe-only nitrogenase accessory protein AnfO